MEPSWRNTRRVRVALRILARVSLVEATWLLSSARCYAEDPRVRSAAAFARGGGAAAPVHRSQVSRWEAGEVAPSYAMVQRYERVCNLPEGQLCTAVDLVNRDECHIAPVPALQRPPSPDPVAEAETLLVDALGNVPLTGLGWDRLSALLGDLPAALLLPDQWRDLIRRGLQEVDVSVRLQYLQREEALGRIVGHPRAGEPVVDLVWEVLNDPSAQVYSEAAALLPYCPHPRAVDMLTNIVRHPVNVHALRAGLFISSVMLRDGRMRNQSAVDLVNVALGYCKDTDMPYRVRRSAADVLRALKPDSRRRIAHALDRNPGDLRVTSIADGNGPYPVQNLRAVRRRVRFSLEEQLGPTITDETPLMHLLDYLTVETNDDHRSHALWLLMILPFGPAVGRAYVEELRRALDHRDMLAIHEALSVLCSLAPIDDLTTIVDVAVREHDLPAGDDAAVEACWALGNAKGTDTGDHTPDRRVEEAVAAVLNQRASAPPRLLEAWAYALGMRGQHDILNRLGSLHDHQPDETWEKARRWWLDLPPYLAKAATSR